MNQVVTSTTIFFALWDCGAPRFGGSIAIGGRPKATSSHKESGVGSLDFGWSLAQHLHPRSWVKPEGTGLFSCEAGRCHRMPAMTESVGASASMHHSVHAGGSGRPTVSHLLGEMTWLLSQSRLHHALSLRDLEWLVMPPLALEQFYLFRDELKPVGLALWANCTPQAVSKLAKGLVEGSDRLTLEEWNGGDETWLVDLIAPFATSQNRHREVMMADLIAGPLAGRKFHFHQVDAATGERSVQTIEANAGEELTATIEASLRAFAGSETLGKQGV